MAHQLWRLPAFLRPSQVAAPGATAARPPHPCAACLGWHPCRRASPTVPPDASQALHRQGWSTFFPSTALLRRLSTAAAASSKAPQPIGRPVRVEVEHVGKTYLVHSGKEMIRVNVTSGMVDHKFGEFVRTRKPPPRKPPPKAGGGRK